MNSVEVLVISLRAAEERRRLMRAQLELPGMPPYRFIDALDARTEDPASVEALADQDECRRGGRRRLMKAEIACAHSHLLAYEAMLGSGLPAAVILEDDVLLSHQFSTVLPRVLGMVDPTSAQLVLLSHMDRYSAWGARRVDRLRRLCRPYEAYGAHAYLITSAAARKLLARLRPLHTVADDWRYIGDLVEIRGLVPYLVGTSPLSRDSQIGDERFALRMNAGMPDWLQKYFWQKFLFQIFVKPVLRLHRDKKTW